MDVIDNDVPLLGGPVEDRLFETCEAGSACGRTPGPTNEPRTPPKSTALTAFAGLDGINLG